MTLESQFYEAIAEEELKEAEDLIKKNPNLDVNWKNKDESGYTALHLAANKGIEALVNLLLSHPKIDVNLPDDQGWTPFFVASWEGNVEILKLFLAHPDLKINAETAKKETALSFAIQSDKEEIVKCMLASGRSELNLKGAAQLARDKTFTGLADLLDKFKDGFSSSLALQTRQTLSRELGMPLEAIVEFDGNKRILQLPIDSMEALVASIREQFQIVTPVKVQVYRAVYTEYVDLTKAEELSEDPVRLKVFSQALSWWGWSPDAAWVEKGFSATRYHSLLVKEAGNVHNSAAFEKFKSAATAMGFDPEKPHKIFAVSNPKLLISMENYRDQLWGKHRKSPDLFNKDDWKNLSNAPQRRKFLEWRDSYISKFHWNTSDPTNLLPAAIPMMQGTTEAAAWQICQQGFGTVATTDKGFYGQGIYFTTKLSYASQYAKASPSGDGKVFILSMVIPGNSFPVTEHPNQSDSLNGKACKTGYQSHFSLVNGTNIANAFPLTGAIDPAVVADELVTFEGAQSLPVFVFYVK